MFIFALFKFISSVADKFNVPAASAVISLKHFKLTSPFYMYTNWLTPWKSSDSVL